MTDEREQALPAVVDETGEVVQWQATDNAGVAALAALSDDEFQRRLRVLEQGRRRVQAIKESLMLQGTDYGLVPGTGNKPTLLKPGAEKLAEFYRLAAEILLHERHGDGINTPLIAYVAECRLHLGTTAGPVVAVGWGVCSNWERKYRYRNEWVGSGRDRQRMQVENPDPWEQANTVAKMAEKRAFVDGVLRATASSALFTQDLEDMYTGTQADAAPSGEPVPEQAADDPPRAAQRPAADTTDGAYCPVHNKPWRVGRGGGYYCSSRDPNGRNGYCDQKPSAAWVAAQELA